MTVPSGGPKTEGGKEVVRWNATCHGIRSSAPVVPGVEKEEDWEEHRSGILESLQPEGHLEAVLAERVALLSWRLHRVTRYETETIAFSQETVEADLAERRGRPFGDVSGPAHPEDVRAAYESARKTERLLKRWSKLPDDKRLPGEDASSALWAFAGRVDDEVDLEEVRLPEAVPEWAGLYGDTAEWDGWTVGLVRACVSTVASHADEEEEELLKAAKRMAWLDVVSAKASDEKVEHDLKNMVRERLLPDDETLGKVARYEAHLSRLFHKALHELEAIQIRRTGGAAPLARLDVDGLAGS